MLDSTDEAELDKQIKVLEDDLHVIRINSFKLPETDKDTRKSFWYKTKIFIYSYINKGVLTTLY